MARTMITLDYPTTIAGMRKAAIDEAVARGDFDWADMLRAKGNVKVREEAHATMFEVDDNTGRDTSNAPRRLEPMAKEGQLNFITSLLERFDRAGLSAPVYTQWVKDRKGGATLTATQASAVIADLKKALGMEVNPRYIMQQHDRSRAGVPTLDATELPAEVVEVAAPVAPAKAPLNRDALKAVPDGYYALRREDAPDTIDFLRIKHKKDGFISVKRVLGGGADSPRLEPMRWAQALAFAARITEVGVDVSHKLYADEMRRCYLCNLELTDEDSRAVGMGPTCRTK